MTLRRQAKRHSARTSLCKNFTPQELHSAGTSLRQQLHQINREANIELRSTISKRSYIEGGAYIDIPSGIDIPADRYIPLGFDICFASVFIVKFLRSEVAGAVKFALQVKFRRWRSVHFALASGPSPSGGNVVGLSGNASQLQKTTKILLTSNRFFV